MISDPRIPETTGSQGRAGTEAELLDLLIDGHNSNFAAIAALQLGQGGDVLDIYPVTTYGADPTGVEDSTGAVRAALAAAWANVQATGRRSVVFFPAGVFRFIEKTVSRHLDINGMTNLAFVGTSSGRSRLKLAGSAGGGDWYLFAVRGGSKNIVFRDLVMDMSELTNPDPSEQNHLIQIGNDCTDVTVIDCDFSDTVGEGIRLLGEFGAPVESVMIRGCRFIDCGRAGISFQRWVRRVSVLGNQFWGGDDQQIDFEPTGYGLPFNPEVNHTTGTAATLTDPTASYQTWGITVGDPIYNVTYGTLCQVLSVDSQTSLTVTAGATTWNDVRYYFPLHNSHHLIANNQFRRPSGLDVVVTLSGSYGVTFVDNIVDGCVGGVDLVNCIIARNQIITNLTGVNQTAIHVIKAASRLQILNNVVTCRNALAVGRSGITVADQIRGPESVTIAGNQIRMETRGVAIAAESCKRVSIQDNTIILATPGDNNQSGAISVRAVNFPTLSAIVTGNDIIAEGGTWVYGIGISASPDDIHSCIVGGGSIDGARLPVAFSESNGTILTPPVLLPMVVEDGSTPIVPPVTTPWVILGGVGGGSAFTQSFKPGVYWGTGTPEGVLTAGVGSLALRRDNAAAAYLKTTGVGKTGWVQIATV